MKDCMVTQHSPEIYIHLRREQCHSSKVTEGGVSLTRVKEYQKKVKHLESNISSNQPRLRRRQQQQQQQQHSLFFPSKLG